MIIKVDEKEIKFYTKSRKPREVVDIISKEAGKLGKALSHIVVDGEEVRNDLVAHIEEHFEDIEVVEAVLIEKINLPIENAAVVKDAIDSVLPIMDILAEDFRLGVSERGWKEFENLIDTILFCDKTTKRVFSMFIDAGVSNLTAGWDSVRNAYLRLDPILKKLQKVLDDEKNVEAGDIIQNEIKPILEKVSKLIEDKIFKPVRAKSGK